MAKVSEKHKQQILDLLKQRTHRMGELAEILGMTTVGLRFHLSQLELCGCITRYMRGNVSTASYVKPLPNDWRTLVKEKEGRSRVFEASRVVSYGNDYLDKMLGVNKVRPNRGRVIHERNVKSQPRKSIRTSNNSSIVSIYL